MCVVLQLSQLGTDVSVFYNDHRSDPCTSWVADSRNLDGNFVDMAFVQCHALVAVLPFVDGIKALFFVDIGCDGHIGDKFQSQGDSKSQRDPTRLLGLDH